MTSGIEARGHRRGKLDRRLVAFLILKNGPQWCAALVRGGALKADDVPGLDVP
jgi:hypothetical protein